MNKQTKFTVIFFLLILAVCLIAPEIVMTVHNHIMGEYKRIWIPDPFIGHIHSRKNSFIFKGSEHEPFNVRHKTNSLGLMGKKEARVPKPKNVFRILALGDSFTEALQVEDDQSYIQLLGKKLNQAPGKDPQKTYETFNAGISGYSPIRGYQFYRNKLTKLQPDVVIYQMWGNNVFEDNKTIAVSALDQSGMPIMLKRFFHERFLDEESDEDYFRRWKAVYPLHSFLIDKSRFYEYIYTTAVKYNKNNALNKAKRNLPEFDDENQFFIFQKDSPLFQDAEFRKRTLEQTTKYLLALKEEVEKSGAVFVILNIPLEAQLNKKEHCRHTERYFKGQPAIDYFNLYLKKICRENNLNCLDVLDVFEANKEQDIFLDYDGHLTGIGHTVVTEALFSYLMDQNLL